MSMKVYNFSFLKFIFRLLNIFNFYLSIYHYYNKFENNFFNKKTY